MGTQVCFAVLAMRSEAHDSGLTIAQDFSWFSFPFCPYHGSFFCLPIAHNGCNSARQWDLSNNQMPTYFLPPRQLQLVDARHASYSCAPTPDACQKGNKVNEVVGSRFVLYLVYKAGASSTWLASSLASLDVQAAPFQIFHSFCFSSKDELAHSLPLAGEYQSCV